MNRSSIQRLGPCLWPPLAVGLLALALLAATSFTSHPLQSWLAHMGVPAQKVAFGDLRVLADTMQTDSRQPSMDKTEVTAPTHRFPYPSIWRLWSYLGLTPQSAPGWGVALGLSFLLAAVLAVRPQTHGEGLYLAALLCSPVCVLLLERANGDSLLFLGLAVGVISIRNAWINASVIFLCGCAKLYPVAAAACLLLYYRRSWRLIVLVMAGLGGYMLVSWNQWQNVAAKSIRVPYFSFGVSVPIQWIGLFGKLNIPYYLAYIIGLVPVLIVVAGTIAWTRRTKWSVRCIAEREARALLGGTAVIGAAFLLGSRFQYSFVYALFCVPALFRGAYLADDPARKLCLSALVLLMLFFWWDAIIGEHMLSSVLLKHAVCVSILALLLALSLKAVAGLRSPPSQHGQ